MLKQKEGMLHLCWRKIQPCDNQGRQRDTCSCSERANVPPGCKLTSWTHKLVTHRCRPQSWRVQAENKTCNKVIWQNAFLSLFFFCHPCQCEARASQIALWCDLSSTTSASKASPSNSNYQLNQPCQIGYNYTSRGKKKMWFRGPNLWAALPEIWSFILFLFF